MPKMSTLAIVTRFKRIYQETSDRFYDASWQIEAINDAVDFLDGEIADLHPEFMGSLSTTLSYTANQQEEDLPDGYVETVMVEVTDRGGPPYPRLRPAQFVDRSIWAVPSTRPEFYGSGVGEPEAYYIRGVTPAHQQHKIGWIPIPARTALNNVTAWYHGTRADITAIDGTTYPDMAIDWHPLIPWAMAFLAASVDGRNPEFYADVLNSRLEKRLAAALRGRTENQYEQVEWLDDE